MATTLQEILDAVEGTLSSSYAPLTVVRGVTADSRAVTPGVVFVAVPGVQVDGHRFIRQAVANGAVAVIGELAEEQVRSASATGTVAVPYIQVAHARRALSWAAAALEGYPSRALAVIGVTGTDGKTTTCTLIESILHAATQSKDRPEGAVGVVTTVGARIRGRVVDTGLHVTTPDAPEVQRFLAEMREEGCAYAVIESTSHGLHQGRVAAVEYDIAAVTNITHEHLDYHGTGEAYVAAKALLFRSLFHGFFHGAAKPNTPRFAVLNRDDDGSYGALMDVLAEEARHTDRAIPVRTYGLSDRADVWADGLRYDPGYTEMVVRWWGEKFAVRSRLIGEFNVYNMLCAAAVGLGMGLPPETVRRGIEAVEGILGRMERMDAGQPFLAVVDFAHSPVSLERALHTLRPLVGTRPDGSPGKLIAVFGSAGLRDRSKRRLMGAVSGRLADYTIVTAEDPRTEDLAEISAEIASGIRDAGAPDGFTIIADRPGAIRAAVSMAQAGDVVAAFGKGHERSMCFGATEFPWSDQAAMLDALHGRVPTNRLPTTE